MHHQIERLKDHYILCGCGAVGREIVQAFLQAKVPFVVLEKNPEDAEIPRELDILVVQGDATDEEDLAEAGITRAKGLISALHHDPDNVFVTLTARQLNPNLQIVSRASEKGTEAKLKRAGADRVISPYEIAGRRMASTVLQPAVVNFLDVIIHEEGMDLRLEEVSLDPSSPLVGQSLRQIDAAAKTGAIIVGVLDPHGTPRALTGGTQRITDLIFSIGDTLIALGSDGQINDLKKLAHV